MIRHQFVACAVRGVIEISTYDRGQLSVRGNLFNLVFWMSRQKERRRGGGGGRGRGRGRDRGGRGEGEGRESGGRGGRGEGEKGAYELLDLFSSHLSELRLSFQVRHANTNLLLSFVI